MKKGKIGSRLVALMLSVMMLITFMPMLGDAAYAENGIPDISTDKAIYAVGEEVKVTTVLNDAARGWIGLYRQSDTIPFDVTSVLWYYPADFDSTKVLQSIDGKTQTSSQNWGDGSQAEGLLPGDYQLVYVPDSHGKPYEPIGEPVYFTVEDSSTSFVEVYTDSSARKKTDKVNLGDPIYVRANSAAEDEYWPWFGLYKGALTTETWSTANKSMVWAYSDESYDPQTVAYNGSQAYDIIASKNTQGFDNGYTVDDLVAGTYTIILFKNYNTYGPIAYKQFTIGETPVFEGYELENVPEATHEHNYGGYDFVDTVTAGNDISFVATVPEDVAEAGSAWVRSYQYNDTTYSGTVDAEVQITPENNGKETVLLNNAESGYYKLVLFADKTTSYPVKETYLFVRPQGGGHAETEALVYNGQPQTPTITVYKPEGAPGSSIYAEKYYDIIFDNPESTKVGTYGFTVQYKTAVGGSITGTYKIVDSFAAPTFEWADDFSEATAIFESADPDSKAFQEVPAEVTSVTTPATCDAAGKTVYTATVAAENIDFPLFGETAAPFTDTKTVEIPKKDHTPGDAVKENVVEATCSTAGSHDEVVTCTVCGEEISRTTVEDPKLDHTPGEPVEENKVDSTCAAEGSYDEVVYCTVCKEEISRTTKKIEKKDHTPGEAVKEDGADASCEEAGFHFDVVKCTACGEEISRTKVEDPALGHDYQVVEGSAKAATFTEAGKEADQKCSRCGDVKAGAEIPMLVGDAKLSKTKFHYNGKTQKPAVTVTVNGEELAADYYDVSIPSSKKIGTYKVTVKTKGDYAGFEKTLSYQIAPKKVALKSVAKGTKSFTAKWAKQSKTAQKNIDGFQIRYSKSKDFKSGVRTVKVSKKLASKTVKKLTKKKKYYVQIRTYKKVSGKTYYSDWSASKYVTTK